MESNDGKKAATFLHFNCKAQKMWRVTVSHKLFLGRSACQDEETPRQALKEAAVE